MSTSICSSFSSVSKFDAAVYFESLTRRCKYFFVANFDRGALQVPDGRWRQQSSFEARWPRRSTRGGGTENVSASGTPHLPTRTTTCTEHSEAEEDRCLIHFSDCWLWFRSIRLLTGCTLTHSRVSLLTGKDKDRVTAQWPWTLQGWLWFRKHVKLLLSGHRRR